MSEEMNLLREWLQEPTPTEFLPHQHLYQQEKLRLVEQHRPEILSRIFRFKRGTSQPRGTTHTSHSWQDRRTFKAKQQAIRKVMLQKGIDEKNQKYQARKAKIKRMVQEEIDRRQEHKIFFQERHRKNQVQTAQDLRARHHKHNKLSTAQGARQHDQHNKLSTAQGARQHDQHIKLSTAQGARPEKDKANFQSNIPIALDKAIEQQKDRIEQIQAYQIKYRRADQNKEKHNLQREQSLKRMREDRELRHTHSQKQLQQIEAHRVCRELALSKKREAVCERQGQYKCMVKNYLEAKREESNRRQEMARLKRQHLERAFEEKRVLECDQTKQEMCKARARRLQFFRPIEEEMIKKKIKQEFIKRVKASEERARKMYFMDRMSKPVQPTQDLEIPLSSIPKCQKEEISAALLNKNIEVQDTIFLQNLNENLMQALKQEQAGQEEPLSEQQVHDILASYEFNLIQV